MITNWPVARGLSDGSGLQIADGALAPGLAVSGLPERLVPAGVGVDDDDRDVDDRRRAGKVKPGECGRIVRAELDSHDQRVFTPTPWGTRPGVVATTGAQRWSGSTLPSSSRARKTPQCTFLERDDTDEPKWYAAIHVNRSTLDR